MKLFLVVFLILTLSGPLFILLTNKIDFRADWRTANRDSVDVTPDPKLMADAIIQVYSARTFNWRGIFAVHTWLAVKAKNADHYTVYQVIGWRFYRNLPPVSIAVDVPDRKWFDQVPLVVLDIRGEKAEKLIPQIEQAVKSYPYQNEYRHWPGPNSNTFIAWIAQQTLELGLALPSNAVGKDYFPGFVIFARAPSGTGFQISFHGVFGTMVAVREGLEINLFGLVYGISPMTLTLKLPGFGDITIERKYE